MHPTDKAIRTTLLGIGLSLVLVVVKFLAGHIGHSYALIADATETATDVLSSFLLWVGLRISAMPADQRHPYGHGKAEPLAAVALSLFLLGTAIWIAFHAIGFIVTPHELPHRFTLAILLVVMVIKESMYRYVRKIGREIGSQAVLADAVHHRSDALTSLAALIGITIALATGYEAADDWAAIFAAGIIFYNGATLLKPALNEIMDAAPNSDIVSSICQQAQTIPDVKRIEKCQVRKMGLDYYVDMHIEVLPDLTVAQGHDVAHQVKQVLLLSDKRIRDVLIHVEPFEIV